MLIPHEDSEGLDLSELADQAGVTTRTVRYYVQQGVLPPPEGRGPGSHWTRGHLNRLRLIRRLQDEHLPLAEIRQRLNALDDRAVRLALREAELAAPQTEDALGYIRGLLGAKKELLSHPTPSLRRPDREPGRRQGHRETWERINLTPDIELHLRRPLSRKQNLLVERLLDVVADFKE